MLRLNNSPFTKRNNYRKQLFKKFDRICEDKAKVAEEMYCKTWFYKSYLIKEEFQIALPSIIAVISSRIKIKWTIKLGIQEMKHWQWCVRSFQLFESVIIDRQRVSNWFMLIVDVL